MSTTLLVAGLLPAASHTAAHFQVSLAHGLALFQPDAINSGNAKTLTTFVVIAAVALASQAVAILGIAYVVFKLRSELISHVGEIKAKMMPLIDKSHTLVSDLTPQVKDITGKVQTLVTDLSPTVKSITTKVETLVTDLSPQITGITAKVHTITGHVEEISGVARDKVNEFGPTITAAKMTADRTLVMTNETVAKTNETVRATISDVNEKARAQVNRFNGIVTDVLDVTVKFGKALEYGVTQPAREVAGFANGAKATFEHLLKNYGGIFKFGSKGKQPTSKPVVPYTPESMGRTPAKPFGSGAAAPDGMKKEFMDERDLDL